MLNVKRAIAARIECAHRRASAGSADNIQLDARGLEYFENPNVRKATIAAVGRAIESMLSELVGKKPEALVRDRRQKFLTMGAKGIAA